MELVDQACDVVDVTAGHLRNIHVRYLTRCEVPHAFGFAYTGQTRPNRRVAVVDQVTATGVRITANVDSHAVTTLAMPTFAGRVPVHGWRFHVHAVSLPMMGVPTPPSRKTSTCLTLPSPVLI